MAARLHALRRVRKCKQDRMMVTTSVVAADELASRIEQAYLRRRAEWRHVGESGQVWQVAAATLRGLHRSGSSLPLDPELYVASQTSAARCLGPWEELVGAAAERRYRRKVRQIIQGLRRELREEIAPAETRIRRGESVESALRAGKPGALSPLGLYLVAHRAGRPDLAESYLAAAQEQHRACPLYRSACEDLISRAAYPVIDLVPGLEVRHRERSTPLAFSAN